MKIADFNATDTLAAGLVVLFGLGVLVGGSTYSIGTLTRMGPGFLPVAFGALMIVLGLGMLAAARNSDTPSPAGSWRGAFTVSAAMLAWALLVEHLGFLLATFALVVIVSLAERGIHPLRVIVLALGLSGAGYLIFIYCFAVPLPLLPW